MAILSIQSSVAAGHVGNRAAVLPLQLMGFDVWPVDTVIFSNHPAHGGHRGRTVSPAALTDLLDGIEALGLWPRCDGILSGYLGGAGAGPVILDAVKRVRAARPDTLYLCDPVFGDNGEIYVELGIVDFFRNEGIACADVTTPNAFEAAHLTGIDVTDVASARTAAIGLCQKGPRITAVTGVRANGSISTVAATPDGSWLVTTPEIVGASHGAGDLFAALFLGHLLKHRPVPDALAETVSAVHAIIDLARNTDSVDLPLVSGRHLILDPPEHFPAQSID